MRTGLPGAVQQILVADPRPRVVISNRKHDYDHHRRHSALGVATFSPLRCHLHPPMNDSHRLVGQLPGSGHANMADRRGRSVYAPHAFTVFIAAQMFSVFHFGLTANNAHTLSTDPRHPVKVSRPVSSQAITNLGIRISSHGCPSSVCLTKRFFSYWARADEPASMRPRRSERLQTVPTVPHPLQAGGNRFVHRGCFIEDVRRREPPFGYGVDCRRRR
jgi:hypothetical protein